jgi:putative transposase
MPQSLDCVLLHIIFSTKNRQPVLRNGIQPDLYRYMSQTIRNIGCECPLIGGVADHIHLAIRLSRTISIASLVEQTKTSSSKWLKTQSDDLTQFAWQQGYGVFSVGPSDQEKLLRYIANQEEHHQTKTFQEEYRAFLTKYGIAFDEQYVWD